MYQQKEINPHPTLTNPHRGLITISKDYKIINSSKIKDAVMDEKTREWFGYYNNRTIVLPDKYLPGKDFIEYHNDVIFKS